MLKRFADLAPVARPRAVQTAFATLSFAAALVVSGCGAGRMLPDVAATSAKPVRGMVRGGQQPVSGALIQLWAAGSASNASAATQLLTQSVFSDASGGFGISNDYTCPSATTQVYLTATGGNPGLSGSVNNAALSLVAALGDCGSLATVPSISLNELTTVAAAYGLAPFATGVDHVGASATNLAGLRSALQTTMLLASPYSGFAPAATLPANARTETSKLVTLANILSSCVNSSGGAECTSLANDASTPGFGTPADTFQMALMVAQHPGNNVAALFNDAPAYAPFGGSLAVAPNDWSMSISYTGGNLGRPNSVTIDAVGDVWVSNNLGGVSVFTPQGAPVFPAGVTGGMGRSSAATADSLGRVWVANGSYDGLHPNGSIALVAADGTVISGSSGFTAGGINLPDAIASAPNGTMLIANSGASTLTVLSSNGQAVSGSAGYGSGMLSTPSAIAVDASSNMWVANKGNGQLIKMDTSGNMLLQSACCSTPDSIVIDRNGNLWVGDSSNGTVTEVRSDGFVIQVLSSATTQSAPRAMAIDGSSHIFVADYIVGGLEEMYDSSFAASGTQVTGVPRLGLDTAMHGPSGVAVDASGTVWVSSRTDNRLVSFIGLAVPVKTPVVGSPVQP